MKAVNMEKRKTMMNSYKRRNKIIMKAVNMEKRKTMMNSYKWRNITIMKAVSMKKRKTMMNRYVPPEIVREIFLNLPCKSLCRFRSISKQYHSHIDDDQFIEEHRKRNMKASHILTWDTTNPSNLHLFNMSMDSYTYIKTIPTYKYEHMLPSSYSMVCLHGFDNKNIALFNPNPLSGEIIPLPDMPEPFAFETINKPCAPMPTTLRYNFLGFGLDPDSRRYKIVQLIVRDEAILRFHMLTVIRSGSSWRTVEVSKKILVAFFRYQPICVGGVLYWEFCNMYHGAYISVLILDLRTEEMKIIQAPAKWRGDLYGNGAHLALLEGKLCCYEMTPPTDMLLTMNIWKLEFDSNNKVDWDLQYKLEIYGLNSEISPLIPLYLYGNKRIIFQDEFLKGLYYYDIEDNCLQIYPMTEKVKGFADTLRLIVHSETVSNPLD